MQGGRDYQVTRDDYDRFAAALANNHNAKLVLFPTLNHLFMSGEGPPTPDEYENPGHVDSAVIKGLADFISGL